MKKIRIIPIMLFTLLYITGCGEKKASIDDLTIYDTVTRQEIKIGDSKDKVDKILGTEKKDDVISVKYSDNKVSFIEFHSAYNNKITERRYQLKCGISCDSTVTDFLEKYPTAEDYPYEQEFVYQKVVSIKKDGDKLKFVSFKDKWNYVLDIKYRSYDSIEQITIGEYN